MENKIKKNKIISKQESTVTNEKDSIQQSGVANSIPTFSIA
jgi:hypothetical protein